MTRGKITGFFFVFIIAITVAVVVYKSDRGDEELLIVDSLNFDLCEIFTLEGQYLTTYPLGYCQFLKDHEILAGRENVVLMSDDGTVIWSKNHFTDHDRVVDGDSIYLLTRTRNETGKKFYVHHRLLELDKKTGTPQFFWKVEEHMDELARYSKTVNEAFDVLRVNNPNKHRFYYNYYPNSIVPVPLQVRKALGRENASLILIGTWHTYGLFIIDKATSSVVWGYSLEEHDMSGPHTPFFNSDGKLVFFINDLYFKDPKKNVAGIGIMDLATKELKTIPLKMNGKEYYTFTRGSLAQLKDGYILSFYDMGLLLRLDKQFAFVSEHKLQAQKNELYRARIVQKSRIQFLLDGK